MHEISPPVGETGFPSMLTGGSPFLFYLGAGGVPVLNALVQDFSMQLKMRRSFSMEFPVGWMEEGRETSDSLHGQQD